MPKPQQPELRRSELQGFDPDAPVHFLPPESQGTEESGGPIPVDNLPGHHPEQEQDKPSGDDFVAKVKAKAAESAEAEADEAGTADAGEERDEPVLAGAGVATGSTTSPTQTSAPRSTAGTPRAVPLTTGRLPAPAASTPPWVNVAATLAGAPFRLTAAYLRFLRRVL